MGCYSKIYRLLFGLVFLSDIAACMALYSFCLEKEKLNDMLLVKEINMILLTEESTETTEPMQGAFN